MYTETKEEDSKMIFRKYYDKVNSENICELSFNRGDGYVKDILIVSTHLAKQKPLKMYCFQGLFQTLFSKMT